MMFSENVDVFNIAHLRDMRGMSGVDNLGVSEIQPIKQRLFECGCECELLALQSKGSSQTTVWISGT
jgi:hypothetical protein